MIPKLWMRLADTGCTMPQTPNLKPQAPNPNPQTPNLQIQTPQPKPRTRQFLLEAGVGRDPLLLRREHLLPQPRSRRRHLPLSLQQYGTLPKISQGAISKVISQILGGIDIKSGSKLPVMKCIGDIAFYN